MKKNSIMRSLKNIKYWLYLSDLRPRWNSLPFGYCLFLSLQNLLLLLFSLRFSHFAHHHYRSNAQACHKKHSGICSQQADIRRRKSSNSSHRANPSHCQSSDISWEKLSHIDEKNSPKTVKHEPQCCENHHLHNGVGIDFIVLVLKKEAKNPNHKDKNCR